MTDNPAEPSAQPAVPVDSAQEARRLLHDMNNALEIIIQASYLVGTLDLSEDGRQWLKLLDQGIQQAAGINKELRDLIRAGQASSHGPDR